MDSKIANRTERKKEETRKKIIQVATIVGVKNSKKLNMLPGEDAHGKELRSVLF